MRGSFMCVVVLNRTCSVTQDQRAELVGGDGDFFFGGTEGGLLSYLVEVLLLPATWPLGGVGIRGRKGNN